MTNEKIAAVITDVPGAKEAMVAMGWEEEGEFLVLPAGKSVTMREVRDIDAARAALKKLEDEEFKKRVAARNAARNPDKARLLAEMAADRAERAARDPVTRGSTATPRGAGTVQTAAGAGCSGTSGG